MNWKKETKYIHETPSGNLISLDTYKLFKSKDLPTTYLQAGLHGIEILGIPVLYELIEKIRIEDVKTNLIISPIANPLGLDSQIMGVQMGYNNIHTSSSNPPNWNRTNFPKGTLENELEKALFSNVEEADIIFDIHTSFYESPFYVYCNEKYIEKAKKFGFKFIGYWKNAGNFFEDTCFKLGKEAYTLEFGASRVTREKDINQALNSLLNILSGKNKLLSKYFLWDCERDQKRLNTPESGIITWKKKAGEVIRKDEHYLNIYNRHQKIPVTAEKKCFLLYKSGIHAPYKGQQIGEVVEFKEE